MEVSSNISLPSSLRSGRAFWMDNGVVLVYNGSGKGDSVYFDLATKAIVLEFSITFGKRTNQSMILMDRRYLMSGSGGCYDIEANKWKSIKSKKRKGILYQSPTSRSRIYFFDTAKLIMDYVAGLGNDWVSIPPLPQEIRNPTIVECQQQLYVISGNLIQRYDHESQQWRVEQKRLKVSRYNAMAVVIERVYIVLLGGQDQNGAYVGSVEIYNTSTKASAIMGNLQPPRTSDAAAITFNDKVYVIGGEETKISKISLDYSALPIQEETPEQLDQRSAVSSPAMYPQRRRSNSVSTPATTTKLLDNGANSPAAVFAANPSAAVNLASPSISLHMLSKIPTLPTRPTLPQSTTIRGRLAALQSYCQKLHSLIKNSEFRVKALAKDIRQAYDAGRDLELDMLHKGHDQWLADTQRLLRDAEQEIEVKKKLLEAAITDRKDTALMGSYSEAGDNVPSQLRCPITLQLMKDPVVAADGNTYEREALKRWFARNDKPISPLTGGEMPSKQFFPCHTLKTMCLEHMPSQQYRVPASAPASAPATTPATQNKSPPLVPRSVTPPPSRSGTSPTSLPGTPKIRNTMAQSPVGDKESSNSLGESFHITTSGGHKRFDSSDNSIEIGINTRYSARNFDSDSDKNNLGGDGNHSEEESNGGNNRNRSNNSTKKAREPRKQNRTAYRSTSNLRTNQKEYDSKLFDVDIDF